MAESAAELTLSTHAAAANAERVRALLATLELMASGSTEKRLPISEAHDELDAIAYAINVLVGELQWTTGRVVEAQEARAAELRDAVDAAERANASKTVFLRNVSHEIRTPITAMLGFAELLASPNLPEEERVDLVRRLQANGQALLSLVGGLLDLARLDADKVVLAPEPVVIFELVHEVIASLEIESRAKGLDIRIELPGAALGSVYTDRYRLRQVLVNVIGNAIKFTEIGAVVVSLRSQHALGGDEWLIDVTDSGIGIPAEHQGHLFEPFEQADSSIASRYGGAGLGLAVSRRLIEQLGGSLVLLDSQPGCGSTFRIILRALAAGTGADAPPSSSTLVPAGALKDVRILVAEDHTDVQIAMSRLLTLAGASVEVAGDGRQAVSSILSGTFDVLLLDLRMPIMDGLEVARILRKRDCRIPIVAITADPSTMRRVEAAAAGCDACLSKPFTMTELVATIDFLRNRHSTS